MPLFLTCPQGQGKSEAPSGMLVLNPAKTSAKLGAFRPKPFWLDAVAFAFLVFLAAKPVVKKLGEERTSKATSPSAHDEYDDDDKEKKHRCLTATTRERRLLRFLPLASLGFFLSSCCIVQSISMVQYGRQGVTMD